MGMAHRLRLPIEYGESYNWANTKITVPIYPLDKDIEKYKMWCKDRIGSNGWNYYGRYRKIPYEFRFKRPEDMVAFKLTFGL